MKKNKLYVKIDWNNHDTINFKTDFKFYLEMYDGEIILESEIIKEQSELEIIEILNRVYSNYKIDLKSIVGRVDEENYISIIMRLLLSLYMEKLNNHDYINISYEDELTMLKYSNKEFVIEF